MTLDEALDIIADEVILAVQEYLEAHEEPSAKLVAAAWQEVQRAIAVGPDADR
jgi:hypothetical protein